MADSSAPPRTFIELLVRHQGPEFMDGRGTIECLCGVEVANDVEWARHVHQMLIDANLAVVSLDGILRLFKTVVEPDGGDA